MYITIVVILLLVGVLFLLLELFIIPGISLAGIAGAASMIVAVYLAYAKISSAAGHLTLLGGIILTGIAIWLFLKSKALDKMALKAGIDGKNDPLKDISIQAGDTGIASSRLAPMGKVKINGHVVEAKSPDGFIEEGTPVRVTEVLKTNVVVERAQKSL